MPARRERGNVTVARDRGNVTVARDRGNVTVEAAISLAALVVVLTLCLAAIAALIAQVRLTDAAGVAARLAARGDDGAATAALEQLAPAGTSLSIAGDAELLTVRVTAPALGSLLPGVELRARAIAAREPALQGP